MPPADETVLPTPGTEQGQGVLFFFDIGVLGYASVYDVYIVFFRIQFLYDLWREASFDKGSRPRLDVLIFVYAQLGSSGLRVVEVSRR